MKDIQISIDESLHQRLQELSRQSGRSISRLVREALVRAYGMSDRQRKSESLRGIAGLWRDRDDFEDTDDYLRGLRGR